MTAKARSRSAAAVLATLCASLAVIVTPGTALAGGGASIQATCPSYIKVVQSNVNGSILLNNNYIHSLTPGRQIVIRRFGGIPDEFNYIAHTGVVTPGSRVTFDYYDYYTGALVDSHQTNSARSNGVIHHEDEIQWVGAALGSFFNVYGSFQSGCDGYGDTYSSAVCP